MFLTLLHTLAHLCILLHTLAYSCILLHTQVFFSEYFCILLHTIAYSCIFLHILAYSCILLHILAYSCIFLHTLAYSCIPLHILAYSCILQERMALSLADLITCSCLLTANMLIREAYNGYSKGEKAMVPQLREFFTTLGLIQRDAVWWVHTTVPSTFRPQPVDYKLCLRKCLFLEPAETYHGKDNWPPESDRR